MSPYSLIASFAIYPYSCWKLIISLYDTYNTVYIHQMQQFLKISKSITYQHIPLFDF